VSNHVLAPVVVSPQRACEALDISRWTLRRLIQNGKLTQVQISERRVGITWKSIKELVGEAA